MPSSRHRRAARNDFLEWLTAWLRAVLDRASGRRRAMHSRRSRDRSVLAPRPAAAPTPTAATSRRERAEPRSLIGVRRVGVWRLGAGIGLALVLAWLGWRAVADTAAQNLARSDPETALRWSPRDSDALALRAQQELPDPDGDLDAARAWAQEALKANPLDTRALYLLGLIAERKQDMKSAEALMQIAGARSWRDWTTQSWLFNWNVRNGDYARAMPHIDAILRASPDLLTQLYPVLASLTVSPQAFAALTDFLATSPPWRAAFLRTLSARLADGTRLMQLYAALTEKDSPASAEELGPYLDRLIKDGKFEQALQAWQATLPAEERSAATVPFNRDFELPLDGLAFNWLVDSVAGADIRVVSDADTGRKRALRVQFSGARVKFENVKQLLVLRPGAYALGGRVKADELRSVRGLRWRIFCAEGEGKTLAETPLVSGTVPWSEFAADFRVPDANCRAQWLRLELPARIASETKIEGQVWYQFLRVSRR